MCSLLVMQHQMIVTQEHVHYIYIRFPLQIRSWKRLLYHACYTASARRCETVEYVFKRGSSGQLGLLTGANFGWSGSALKHSES